MDDKVPVKSSTSLTTPQVTLFDQPRTCEAKIDDGIGVDPPRQTPKRFKWDPHRVKQSTPNEKARRTLLGGPTSDHPPSKAVMNRTFGALLSNTPLPSSDGAERKPPLQTPLVLCHSVDKIVHSTATLDRSPGLILGLSPILPDNQSLDAEEGAEFSGSQQVGTQAPAMKLEDTHSEQQLSCSFAKPFPVKGCKRQDLNTFTLNDSPRGTHNCSGLEAVASDNSYRTPTFAELQEDSLCQPGSASVNFSADKQSDGDRRRSLILNCRKPLHNSVPSSSPRRQPTVDLDTFPVTGSPRLPPNTPTDQGKFSKKVSFGSLCNLRAGTSTEKNKKTTETVVGYGSEPTTFLLPTKPATPFPTSQLEEIKDQKPESSQNETIRKSTEASKATNLDCLKEKQLTTRDFDLICSGWEELDTFICCYNILNGLSKLRLRIRP
ncbi:unnamed protein product [Dibothriocephalus latus]|uniref:Uncharacterized protein n=1 Tax=Dibothriocephalus latus TaxID=60516 RepID=A0A3P6U907_DIBLA|nr:unnamed protein product [Dibothriocephalus latus]